jgi:phosphopantetheine adenylyltransferase
MKSFTRFLSEASQSKAVMQASRLGLVSDGHGGWYDKTTGEFIAKTEGGELKFYNQNQRLGAQDPPQNRTPKNQQIFSQQIPQEPQPPEEESSQELATLTVAFGRFNPPTVGHEKLLNKVAKVANGGEYKIYPSRSNDSKKNPLEPDTKISIMRQMYPKHGERIVNDDNFRTIFDVLQKASEDGYTAINIVVGGDRQAEFEKLSNQYNGDLYNFDQINVISAGDRDPDSDGIEGISASKIRKAALEGDVETFMSGMPKSFDSKSAKKLYKILRQNMKVEEGVEVWQVAPKYDWKNLRENYISKNIFRVGQLVENLNTGMIGEIIRRGTNYLICVTENDQMFKSWIKDVVEINKIENPSKNLKSLVKKAVKRVDNNIDGFVDGNDPKTGPYGAFIPQQKNTPRFFKKEWTEVSGVSADKREVGTDSFRKYVMKMTGTQNIKNFINKYKVKK